MHGSFPDNIFLYWELCTGYLVFQIYYLLDKVEITFSLKLPHYENIEKYVFWGIHKDLSFEPS